MTFKDDCANEEKNYQMNREQQEVAECCRNRTRNTVNTLVPAHYSSISFCGSFSLHLLATAFILGYPRRPRRTLREHQHTAKTLLTTQFKQYQRSLLIS